MEVGLRPGPVPSSFAFGLLISPFHSHLSDRLKILEVLYGDLDGNKMSSRRPINKRFELNSGAAGPGA